MKRQAASHTCPIFLKKEKLYKYLIMKETSTKLNNNLEL